MSKHRSAEERTDEIISSAINCICKKGYQATSMEDIIKATSLSKGGVYRFFSSKEEVAQAVFERSINIFLPPVASIIDSTLKKTFFNIMNAACTDEGHKLLRAYVFLLPEILLSHKFAHQFNIHFNKALKYNKELIYSFYPHLDSKDLKVSKIVENYLKSLFFLFDGLVIYAMALKSENMFEQYVEFMEPIFDTMKRELMKISKGKHSSPNACR